MKKIFLTLIMMFIPLIVHAALEISTNSTNLGIGTTSTSNQLGVVAGLAVGSTSVKTTAPVGGVIIDGSVGIGSVNPSNILEIRESNAFTKVYNFDGTSTYSDDTTQAKITYGTPFNILFSTAHILYLGRTTPFSGISVSLKQNTTAVDALIVTYWNGSSWSSLTNTDNTNNFQNDGTISFTAPSDWATTAVNSQTLYWVAIQSTTNFSTQPTIYSIRPGIDSVLATFSSLSDTKPSLIVSQNGNLLSPNVAGTQTSVSTPTTIVVGLTSSRGGRRVDYMCSGAKDQVCINAAITACGGSACKIVLLEGTYNTTAPIYVTQNNLTIQGMGMGKTILKINNNTDSVIRDITSSNASPRLNTIIEDLEIDRSADTKDAVINRKGINLPFSTRGIVDHVYIHDSGATCLAMDYAVGTTITNNVLTNCGTSTATTGNSGIGQGTGEYTNEPQVIANNIITGPGFSGILIEAQGGSTVGLSNNVILANNVISGGSKYGVVIRGTSNVNIVNNIIRSNTLDGVLVIDYAGSTPTNILIGNNNINGNTLGGVNLNSSDLTNISVRNNDLSSNGSGPILSIISPATNLLRFNNNSDTVNYMPGNVGIGSFSPTQVLDVAGTVRMTGFTMTTSPTNGYVLTSDANGNASWTANSGTNYWQTGNVGINTTNNVGISTVNPGQKLDVVGSVRATAFIGDGSALTGISGSGTVNSSTINQVARYNATGAAVTGSTLLYDNLTNVGIGTVNPQTLLAVGTTGQFQVTSTGSISSITGSTNATLSSSTLALTANPVVIKNVSTTSTASTVYVGSAATNGSAEIRATTGTGSGDFIKFTGGTNGGTEIARFLGSGNVGFGSTTPGQKLDVQGTVRFTTGLLNTTSTTGIGWSEHNAGNQACNTTCGTSACVIGLDAGTVGVLNSNFVACTDATADDCVCAGP